MNALAMLVFCVALQEVLLTFSGSLAVIPPNDPGR